MKFTKNILLVNSLGQKYLVKEGKLFNSELGTIAKVVGDYGTELKTNKGYSFFIVKPNLLDLLLKSQRGPQVITPKDFGAIVAYANVDKDSLCLDAGSGSGWLAIQLSKVAKKVVTYELRKDFFEIAKSNVALIGVKNITLKNKDAFSGFYERDADLITLDLLGPENVPFEKSLRIGGYCVAYVPHMEQAVIFCNSLSKNMFVERIIAARETLFEPTGRLLKNKIRRVCYLVFARKIR